MALFLVSHPSPPPAPAPPSSAPPPLPGTSQIQIWEVPRGGGGGGEEEGGGTAGGGLPTDAVNCGAGVYARSGNTSCNFALNVASDYFSSPSNSFDSYSPATGKLYRMSCSGAAPVICTGGNNAAVYIP